MADGDWLALAVHALVGAKSGPLLVILSTQHGTEILPIPGLARVWTELDPRQLRGTVVIIPVANPLAFERGSRSSPIDGLFGDNGNLNRVWPGRPDGWLTERLADALFRQFLSRADFTIDLHGGEAGVAIYYAYIAVDDDSHSRTQARLAKAFGMELMLREVRKVGTLSDFLLAHGGLVLGAELGVFHGHIGGEWTDRPERYPRYPAEVTSTGIYNVMHELDMLPGRPVLPARQTVVSPELAVRPSKAGLLQPIVTAADIGRVVPQGTALATVLSPYTLETVETLVAPFAETIVIGAVEHPFKVCAGDYGVWVADWTTAEHLGR